MPVCQGILASFLQLAWSRDGSGCLIVENKVYIYIYIYICRICIIIYPDASDAKNKCCIWDTGLGWLELSVLHGMPRELDTHST